MIDPVNDIRARWADPGHADSDADKRDVRALLRRIAELEQELVGRDRLHRAELDQLRRQYERDLRDAAAEAREDLAEAHAREREGF